MEPGASPPPESVSLATFLRREKAAILEAWERAISRLPVARTLDLPRLRNHFPEVLDRLTGIIEDTEQGRPVRAPGPEPRNHALERLEQGFDLNAVVAEYAALRECLFELRARAGASAFGLQALNRAIDEAIMASVTRYEAARHRTLAGLDRISAAALQTNDPLRLLRAMQQVFLDTTATVDSAALYLREGDELHLRAAVGLEENAPEEASVRVGSTTSAGQVAATRRPLELIDASTNPLVPVILRRRGARAFYAIPLLEGQELVGVAHIASCSAAQFSAEDRVLFRTMAERVMSGLAQHRLRAELEQERRQLHSVLEVLPVGVIVAEQDGRLVHMNPAAEAVWGRRQLAKSIEEYGAFQAWWSTTGEPVRPEDWAITQALRRGEAVSGQELEIRGFDGRRRSILNSAIPIRGEDGRIRGAVAVNVDVTERRALERERQRAREEMERSFALLDALFASSPLGLLFCDAQLRLVKVNDALAKLDGRPAREHLGRTVRDVAPEVAELLEPMMRQVLRTGQPIVSFEGAATPPHAGHHQKHWLVSFYPVRSRAGEVLGVGGAVVDVTERRDIEARLRDREERLQLIVDALEDHAIYMLDAAGRIATWSRGAEKLKGYRRDEIVGRAYAELFFPEARANREPERLLAMAARDGVVTGEGLRRRSDGSPLEIAYSIWAVRNPDGGLRGFVKIARDIREEKARARREAFLMRVTDRLAASLDGEATLRSVLDIAIPDLADSAIVDLLAEGGRVRRLAFVCRDPENARRAAEMSGRMGRLDEHGPGPGAVMRTGTPLLVREVDERLLRELSSSPEQVDLLRRMRFSSLMVVPMITRGRTVGALTFLMDVSKRHYRDEDLAFALEVARRAALAVDNALLFERTQEALRARDEFLSIASHDLRNPLAGLGLQIDSVARRARACETGSLSCEWVAGRTASMRGQVDRIRALLDDLLDVSRMHADRLALAVEELDLGALVEDVASRLEEMFARAGSALRLNVPKGIRGRSDPLRLDQVMTNLLTNAVKYGAGRPVTVTLAAEGGLARLTVKDEGVGIAPEHHDRVFRRFERPGAPAGIEGTGLGLWIVAKIVHALGGAIDLDSEVGRGATFTITLPLAGPPAQPGQTIH